MKREIKVGLTVVLAIFLLYFIILWAKRIDFFAPDEKIYTIGFEQVSGLMEGDPVNVRGVTLGRVEDILPRQEIVEVRISISASYPLYTDARAEIQLKELMGGKQVTIYPGTNGTAIGSNSVIPGRSSMDFSTSFSAFGQMFEGIDINRVGKIMDRFDQLAGRLEEMLGKIDPNSIDRLLSGAEASTNYLQKMLRESEQEQLPQKLSQTIHKTNELLTAAGSMLEEVEIFMQKADSLTLPKLDQTFASVNQLLDQLSGLETLLNGLENENGLVNRLINDQQLSQQLDTTLLNLNKVLKQIHSERIIVGFTKKRR